MAADTAPTRPALCKKTIIYAVPEERTNDQDIERKKNLKNENVPAAGVCRWGCSNMFPCLHAASRTFTRRWNIKGTEILDAFFIISHPPGILIAMRGKGRGGGAVRCGAVGEEEGILPDLGKAMLDSYPAVLFLRELVGSLYLYLNTDFSKVGAWGAGGVVRQGNIHK